MAVRKNPKFKPVPRKPFVGEVFTRYPGPQPGNPRHRREGYQERLDLRKQQQAPTAKTAPAAKGRAKYGSAQEQKDHLSGRTK